MRCESVLPGEKPIPTTEAEREKCDQLGHVFYKDGPN